MAVTKGAFGGPESQGEQQGRRAYLKDLDKLIQATADELASLAIDYKQDRQSLDQFFSSIYDVLAPAHTQAAFLGRHLAGAEGPLGIDDIRFGVAIVEEQVPFLNAFSDTAPDKTEAQVAAQARLYAYRLYGTTSEAWAMSMPEDLMVYWRLGPSEEHCRDCPAIAASGLQLLSELPTLPGMGATQCRTNCQCYLETEDGRKGPFLLR